MDQYESADEQDDGGTRMESMDEIRAALQARQKSPGTIKEPAASECDETADFRPVRRPSMAMLCVLDDGRQEGEWIRLRQDTTVIGRSDGDVVIPHDAQMSARHLAIMRQVDKGRARWLLNDLESRNGSFARIAKSVIKPDNEILLGGKRYRFQVGSAPATADLELESDGTQVFEVAPSHDVLPSLVEVLPSGDGQKYLLQQAENWIGRSASQCSVVLADPLVSPRHARIYRNARGAWFLENAGSRNGTWLRFKKLPVETITHFQVGEQRCVLKILS